MDEQEAQRDYPKSLCEYGVADWVQARLVVERVRGTCLWSAQARAQYFQPAN